MSEAQPLTKWPGFWPHKPWIFSFLYWIPTLSPIHRFSYLITDSPSLPGYPHHHHCTLQIIQFTNRLWNTTKPHIFFHLPVTTLWLICLPYFLRIWNSFPFSEQFGTGTVGGSNSSKNVPCDATRLRYLPGAAKIFTSRRQSLVKP